MSAQLVTPQHCAHLPAGVIALADFDGPVAEQALLHAANYDPNIAIRRKAIGGFRLRRRVLSEESVPCPGTVPTSPAEAMLASHRAEARRLVSSELASDYDSLHAPDQPPSARQLWEQQALEGELAKSPRVTLISSVMRG